MEKPAILSDKGDKYKQIKVEITFDLLSVIKLL